MINLDEYGNTQTSSLVIYVEYDKGTYCGSLGVESISKRSKNL